MASLNNLRWREFFRHFQSESWQSFELQKMKSASKLGNQNVKLKKFKHNVSSLHSMANLNNVSRRLFFRNTERL